MSCPYALPIRGSPTPFARIASVLSLTIRPCPGSESWPGSSARVVNKDDNAKLAAALKAFDFSGAPVGIRGYTSVPTGMACYALEDYECTRTNYDMALLTGRLNFYGLRAYAEAIHKTNPPVDYLAELKSLAEQSQQGKTELTQATQNIMIVRAALLEFKDRQSERKNVLTELGRAKIYDAPIANEVCWSLVTDLAAAFDAQIACNTAVRLAPGSASLLDSRAVMHFALGDFESAVADFERALSMAPERSVPTYEFGLALALDRRGKGDDKTRAATLKAQALAARPSLEADFAKYTIYAGKP